MKHALLLYTAGTLTLLGCKKSTPTDPTPTPSVAYQGTVVMVDEFGTPKADRSSVSVTVTDTSPNWVVRTDAQGAFKMPLGNVTAGTHQLRFSYAGYGTFVMDNAATGSPIPPITLGQVSTTHTTVTASKNGTAYVIQGSVAERPTAAQPRPYRLFLTRSFAPAPPLPIANAYYLSVGGVPAADGSFTVSLTASDLTAAGFRTGDDVLVYAAGDNPAASTYIDFATGKKVFPASNVTLSSTAASFSF
ncbi:carboxypeptidase-like regulatory domain-containing protein [Hymenobacter sp. BT770]|uniref:carboxypeptidase-like regulatory domain-containing protein n=1 Tax=Hymenobacter sp. BT770 TaxID=2886942 RepID=UPI001D11202E|nr:carboxypeptidase-like regulatory domain-containing protein [Hymenobacter sp. BT770]MCC3153597.1 carboxypeptidase-like regulatory domain-containing protein [Hymenobacter sp. BT770]MDO3415937.1 carboxypeptidase-like regulatory domain-containing protein [Hymenobacter sp. BT770]